MAILKYPKSDSFFLQFWYNLDVSKQLEHYQTNADGKAEEWYQMISRPRRITLAKRTKVWPHFTKLNWRKSRYQSESIEGFDVFMLSLEDLVKLSKKWSEFMGLVFRWQVEFRIRSTLCDAFWYLCWSHHINPAPFSWPNSPQAIGCYLLSAVLPFTPIWFRKGWKGIKPTQMKCPGHAMPKPIEAT